MDILKLDDPDGARLSYSADDDFTVTNPSNITVRTKFAEFKVTKEKSVKGKEETWFHLSTRPAFEIAFLRQEGKYVCVVLIEKRRKAEDPPLTKFPGGYFPDDCDQDTFKQKKILNDTGILFKPSSLNSLGGVMGHAEIVTPISLSYTFEWNFEQEPRAGVSIKVVPLGHAVDMAIAGVLENVSSFSLIMKLYYLQKEGTLIV